MVRNFSSSLFKRIATLDRELKEILLSMKKNPENHENYISEILKKDEEKFNALFDATPIGIFFFSENLIITKANQYLSDFLELEVDELIGLDLNNASDKNIKRLLKMVTKGKDVSFDGKYNIGINNESETYITFFAYPIKLGENDVNYGGIGFIEDQSLQKETERLLEEKERNYQLLFHHAPTGILLSDSEGNIIEINETYAHLLGYKPNELINKSILGIIPESEHEIMLNSIKEVLSGNQLTVQSLNKKKNGSIAILDIQQISIPLSESKFGMLVMANDITEKKKLKQDLQKTQELYKIATDAAQIGIWDIDRLENKLFLDDTILKTLFYDKSDLTGTIDDLKHLIFSEDQKSIFENQKSFVNPDTLELNIEFRVWDKHRNLRWFLNKGKLYCDNSGFVYRVLGTSIEITDMKNAQEALDKARKKAEESEKLKSTFLSNISHEIKTPLSGILGFVDLLKEDLSKEEQEEFIDIIKKSALGLQEVIEGIIDLSRIESGELEFKETECSLDVFFRDLMMIHGKNLKLEEKTHIALKGFDLINHQISRIVTLDQNKLQQILNYLITNAIKFTKEGSIEVGCSLSEDKKNLVFYVKDTGIGIAPEFHDQIFIRFRQVDEAHTRKYGGVGLGLALSKAIIERMNGKIWVESQVNVGTTFFFTIPYKPVVLHSRKSFVANELESNSYDFNNKVFLIIEENDINFSLIKYILKQHNATVLRAIDEESAIKICQSRTPISLILIDSMLATLDLEEGSKKIKKILPKVPIIAQVANLEAVKNDLSLKAVVDDCIAKPINKELLLAKIKRFI